MTPSQPNQDAQAHLAGDSFAPSVGDADATRTQDARSSAEAISGMGECVGDRVGPFALRQQIGEGGFGQVWVAEQERPVRRLVALKILKPGMDSREIIARFEQERQALALMDHPNIARVFDAGATDNGRPYFAMELVRGVRITQYCDEQHLSTKARLELVIQACQAVQHAHQKGIIHRDLKPSNILVALHDGRPQVKVIDFGVAKATQGRLSDQSIHTQFQQMIGTPLYMSPEQADLGAQDVDTRSDIYSLGVLLYELLTGRTPIDASSLQNAGLAEMRRIILEVEPPRPSQRLKTLVGEELSTTAKRRAAEPGRLPSLLRGDLDWIVMKCLEKDRARRYDTANGLAMDLLRHLNNEVVTARAPTRAYLCGKFIRRNKAAFAAVSAVATALVAGIIASAWQAVRARDAERRAVTAFDELRATAPAFAEQARALAAKEQYADAVAKLDYALQLRPDEAAYWVAKGDLLQCQFQLAPAAALYREALRLQPGHARAAASANLCDELLAAKPAGNGELSRESLARLHLAMQQQQRPAAELLPVSRLLGEEKKLLLDYWLARLKDLPVSAEKPLAQRLTIREDGQLALDLCCTKINDLSPLADAPIADLDLSRSPELTDFSPLAGLRLEALNLARCRVTDLGPLRGMLSLKRLVLDNTRVSNLTPLADLRLSVLLLQYTGVSDLSPLRSMDLDEIGLYGTPVADLTPLAGMPIRILNLGRTPVQDFSPLARMPLEQCYLAGNSIADLSIFEGKPLRALSLAGCAEARNYHVLSGIPTLQSLLLPEAFRVLPDKDLQAIAALRNHPTLRQIESDLDRTLFYTTTQPKEEFWRDWDRLQTFLPALRATGFRFSLQIQQDDTYSVHFEDQPVSDLSMLQGAPISRLFVVRSRLSDLGQLRGLPLTFLNASHTPITDLSPLRGMALRELDLNKTDVSDLSPLEGLPLRSLFFPECKNIRDVSPLLKIPTLEQVIVPMSARNIDLLRQLPHLKGLAFGYVPNNYYMPATTAEEFWQKWGALGWMRELNDAGIDFSAGEVDEPGVKRAGHQGKWRVSILSKEFGDCSVFRGAENIRSLNLSGTSVRDLEPLRGMPLESLSLAGCPVTNLLPLASLPALSMLVLPPDAQEVKFLRELPQLRRIGYNEEAKTRQPDQTAADFWREYDRRDWLRALRATGIKIKYTKALGDGAWEVDLLAATNDDLLHLRGAPIRVLGLSHTKVTDLSALSGLPLTGLSINDTAVADLTPLRDMPLKFLRAGRTRIVDLSPLRGRPLEYLAVESTKVTDLAPLRGMPLQQVTFSKCPLLLDLSALADSKGLQDLTLPPNARDIGFLRDFPSLQRMGYGYDPTTFRPDKTAEAFWRDLDAQRK